MVVSGWSFDKLRAKKPTPEGTRQTTKTTTHQAVAVDRQGAPARGQQRELGDHLLRELVRAVHVVPARDDDGQLVRRQVGLGHHLGPGLGRAVRVGRLEHAVLPQALLLAQGGLAVDLVRADVDEAADAAVDARALEEDVGAVGVAELLDMGGVMVFYFFGGALK